MSNLWFKTQRKRVLSRDGNRCQWQGCDCEDPNDLTIHHIKPRSLGGHSDLANLVTMCKMHHSELHRLIRIPNIKQTLKRANIFLALLHAAPVAIRGERLTL